jgi:hypothetical protein
LALAVLPPSGLAPAAEGQTGELIYRRQCTACHGATGEGTDENYPRPLAGDRSVAQLTRLIARTMPKDAPRKCTAEEAGRVAAYIYESFYSRAAQARNKPPHIELSRLTVRQYRNAVADLLGSFRPPGRWDGARGLRGEYFRSRQLRDNDRLLDRVDPTVRFEFGQAAPAAGKFMPHLFSVRWTGAVLAPETGEYEFTIRTEHAARLWVNGGSRPLIDAWVQSTGTTEHRGSIFLLGGRAYPLRLEFSKAKQGVPDAKQTKPTQASIALEWRLPHQAAEIIPRRNLMPGRFPELFVAATPFPPDDRSVGYERGTSVSKAWDQATTAAAVEAAGYVVAHLRELSGVPDDALDRPGRIRDFCLRFVERAFRRPLTDDQKRLYVERRFASAPDAETAVKRVVLLALKSPRFLYREIGGGRDAYDVASRLSFGLWDSLPDRELLESAAVGRLGTRDQVARQAEHMLGDPRARAKLRDFFLRWLKVDQVPDLAKAADQFPGFDLAVATDLRTSLDLFLEDVAWGEASDFRQMFLVDYLYLNGRLARFYGGDLPPDAPFLKVFPGSGERAGVLSHPYLMARFAYTAASSPIHRGVFLARSVLGIVLRPPPEAFAPLAPELHPDLTTRERVALQTQAQACQSCHAVINPLGFTLEHFDAIGRFREREKDRPIVATGAYQTRTGALVRFGGVRDLAAFLAGSQEAQEAFVEHLFQYLVKQPLRAFRPGELADLVRSFADNRYSIRKLMVEMMAESALTPRDPTR